MANVKCIQSVNGSYFEIGISDDGNIYLYNKFTQVPNEFGLYDMEKVKELFDDLCAEIPNSEPVNFASWKAHPNSHMRVLFDDGNVQIYRETKKGKNLCALTSNVASYSEFHGPYIGADNEMITVSRLRQVIKEKREYKKLFQKAVEDIAIGTDDYMWVKIRDGEDGSWEMDEYTYGRVSIEAYVSADKDGCIINTGGLKYAELLKENGVRLI